MKEHIQELLQHVAASHGVNILFESESGSRAWGSPSLDSDYDVRFIYAHQKEQKSIGPKPLRNISKPISIMQKKTSPGTVTSFIHRNSIGYCKKYFHGFNGHYDISKGRNHLNYYQETNMVIRCLLRVIPCIILHKRTMKKNIKPNGKNIEIALELLELSFILKKSVKKAVRKK
jgi:hypothetical protein